MKHFKDQNDEIAAGNADGIELDLKSLGVRSIYYLYAVKSKV